MFSKVIALLLLAASAIAAGPIAEGIYKITNVESNTTVRTDSIGNPIYVAVYQAYPPATELWNLTNAEGNGYTIENVYINSIKMLDSFAAVFPPFDGAAVVNYRDATVFNIESAGEGAFVIELQNENFLWNVEPPVTPRGDVRLRSANGQAVQKWKFDAVQWPPV